MTRKIDFINGNTKKCLMAMVLPMIAAMFLNMAYNLVDSLWIGNLLGHLSMIFNAKWQNLCIRKILMPALV